MCFGDSTRAREHGRWGRSLVPTLGVLMVLPLSALAQSGETADGRPWFVDVSHYAKWPAVGAAGGFIALAAVRHGDAQRVRRELEGLCAADPTRCVTGSGAGAALYLDEEARSLQERHTELSDQARGYLLGGQIALVVGGGMFLLDLIYGKDEPKNIPFTPFEVMGGAREVGFRIRF